MPYEGWHSCDIKPTSFFRKGTIRTIRPNPDTIILIGRPASGGSATVRKSIRWKASSKSEEAARKECASLGGTFHKAT